jgi:hypothetical protein
MAKQRAVLPVTHFGGRLPQVARYRELADRLAEMPKGEQGSWCRQALLLMLEEEKNPLRQQMREAIAEYRQLQQELLAAIKMLKPSSDDPPAVSVSGKKVNVSRLKRMVEGR